EELLNHGDDNRPPAFVGNGRESLTGLDLSGGIENETCCEVAGGRNVDDREGVTLARRLRGRLGEVSGIRHPKHQCAGIVRGWTDVCGWEGSLGGNGLRCVIELGAGGVEVLERTDG